MSDPTEERNMLYEVRDGDPFPILPYRDGLRLQPDGLHVLTIEQASDRFGVPFARLRENWLAMWGTIFPAAIASSQPRQPRRPARAQARHTFGLRAARALRMMRAAAQLTTDFKTFPAADEHEARTARWGAESMGDANSAAVTLFTNADAEEEAEAFDAHLARAIEMAEQDERVPITPAPAQVPEGRFMFIKIGNVILNVAHIVRVTLRVRDGVAVETSLHPGPAPGDGNHLIVFDGDEARAIDEFFSGPLVNVVELPTQK